VGQLLLLLLLLEMTVGEDYGVITRGRDYVYVYGLLIRVTYTAYSSATGAHYLTWFPSGQVLRFRQRRSSLQFSVTFAKYGNIKRRHP